MPTFRVAHAGVPIEIANRLVNILSGKARDHRGIRRGFQYRLAFGFLSKVKQAYIVKSRGGTDDAGIQWAPLAQSTIAGRRKGRSKKIKSDVYKREAARSPREEARETAEAAEEAGTRHEILRDTGILFNSLSPGALGGTGTDVSLSSVEGQALELDQGTISVGTTVLYAGTHHHGVPSRNIPARPLWPDELPQKWLDSINRTAARGIGKAIEVLAQD